MALTKTCTIGKNTYPTPLKLVDEFITAQHFYVPRGGLLQTVALDLINYNLLHAIMPVSET